MNKIIAILLMAVLCFSLLVSCGGKPADTTADNSADTDAVTDEGSKDSLVIDETKLDGYVYTVLVAGNIDYKHGTQHYGNDFYYDETSVDVLSIAKQKWVKSAEQKFDITIEVVEKLKFSDAKGSGQGFKALQLSTTSDDAMYDHCMVAAYDVCNAARNGYLTDLNELEYINLNNSWWDQVANKDLNIQNKMYYTTGDISVIDNVFTHCVFFNKEMIKAKNLDNPYDYVKNNTWTLDNFATIVKAGSDTAGEGLKEEEKVYGLLTWNDSMIQIMAAGDERIASVDDSGNLVYTMYNTRTQTLYDKFTDLALNRAYAVNYQVLSSTGWDPLRKEIFDSNRALFYFNLLSTTTHHRDTETDFGILPYPKLDESQENYGHAISAFHTEFFAVPFRHYSSNISASVSEYLAAKGQQITKPAYYDDTLIGKHIRDDESAEMLDIIFASRVYDVGAYYSVGNIPSRLGTLYKNTTLSFQQIHNESGQMASATINAINTQFMDVED